LGASKGIYSAKQQELYITEMEKLIAEGINNITADDWRKVVMHLKNIIDDAWSKEGILEDAVEQLFINVNPESSDSKRFRQ
jgi:hypothetical protein